MRHLTKLLISVIGLGVVTLFLIMHGVRLTLRDQRTLASVSAGLFSIRSLPTEGVEGVEGEEEREGRQVPVIHPPKRHITQENTNEDPNRLINMTAIMNSMDTVMLKDVFSKVLKDVYKEGLISLDGRQVHQDFLDLEVARGRLSELYQTPPVVHIPQSVLDDLTAVHKRVTSVRKPSRKASGEKLKLYNSTHPHARIPTWQNFHHHMSRHQMYDEADGLVDALIHDLRTLKIKKVSTGFPGGTSLKIKFKFADGSRGIFKPMRFPRDIHGRPDNFYFHDYERHTAEIATFHLDRILGFHRTPPTVGRFINVTSEIMEVCDDKKLKETLFISPAGNKCFYGNCDVLCDSAHAVCGHPDLIKGSLMAFLPEMYLPNMYRNEYANPYSRSYEATKKARFELNANHCDDAVRSDPLYQTGRRFMDLIDLGVFDFLIGNQDRHHYDTFFREWGEDSFIIVYDNGRGFALANKDDLSNLAPLTQCCQIRLTTFEKLLELETVGPPLSVRMERSMRDDLVAPVLTDDYLKALDRRVKMALMEIKKCIEKAEGNYFKVIIDDGL